MRFRIDGPEILPDRFEANDSLSTATPLGSGDRLEADLTIHDPQNDDFFHWTAAADGPLQIDLLFEQSAGDLDLFIYDGPNLDNQIAVANSTSDNEHLVVEVAAGSTYWIGVDGYLGATQYDYTLAIDGPEPRPYGADFDGDGDVDGEDFLAWQTGFGMTSGATSADGDADGDGDVDGGDFLLWQQAFGSPPSPAAADAGQDGGQDGGQGRRGPRRATRLGVVPGCRRRPQASLAAGICPRGPRQRDCCRNTRFRCPKVTMLGLNPSARPTTVAAHIMPGSQANPATRSSLLHEVQAADPLAWKRLVKLYAPLVERWVKRYGISGEDAADIAQEVFTAVHRSVSGFRRSHPGDSFPRIG